MTRQKPKSSRKDKIYKVSSIRISDNHSVTKEYKDMKKAIKKEKEWEKSDNHTGVISLEQENKKSKLIG